MYRINYDTVLIDNHRDLLDFMFNREKKGYIFKNNWRYDPTAELNAIGIIVFHIDENNRTYNAENSPSEIWLEVAEKLNKLL